MEPHDLESFAIDHSKSITAGGGTPDGQSNRPATLELHSGAVPDGLTDHEQWVCWRCEWDADRDGCRKVPIDADTGHNAKPNDSRTWTDFESSLAYHDRDATDTDGVGFVVDDGDKFVGIDLDDCRDPNTGQIDRWALDVIEAVGSYTEVSPSGTGVRIFVLAVLPDGGSRGDVDGADGHLEMYDDGRYLTVTGHQIDDSPETVEQSNDAVARVHAEHIAGTDGDDGDGDVERPSTRATDSGSASESEAPGGNGLRDDEVFELATSARNGEKFCRLWDGDTSAYSSPSEATAALLYYLAFWTGGDAEQMDRLFRRSGLMRKKWDDPRGEKTWGRNEIRSAIGSCPNFYLPVPDDLKDELSEPAVSDGGRNETSAPTVKRAYRSVQANGGTATTAEVVDSPLFDRKTTQARESLRWLEDRGFVEWEKKGRESIWAIRDTGS